MKKIKKRKKRDFATCFIISIFLIGISFFLRELYLKYKTTSICPYVNSMMLEEAEKNMPNYDYIVCLNSMKVIWVKDETAQQFGYSADQMLGVKNYEFLDERYKDTFLSKVLERMAEHEGEDEIVVPTKDKRNLLLKMDYHMFRYKKGGYMAGKIISSVEITDEEAAEYYSN